MHMHTYLLYAYNIMYCVFMQTRDSGVDSSHYQMHLEPYDQIHPFDKFALAFISPEEDKYYVLPQGNEDTVSLALDNDHYMDKYIFTFQEAAAP